MDSNKQIKLGAVISYIALGISIVVSLIYTPWMVSKIGRENYGLYTLAISVVGMFMIDFGLSMAVARFLSKYLAEKRQDKADEFVGAVVRLYLYLDLIIFIILTVVYFLIERIYVKLTPDECQVFKVLFLIVAGFNLIAFPMTPLSGIMSAYEKFAALKLCDLFNKVFTVILIVITLLLNRGVVAMVVANVTGSLVTILLKILIIKTKTPIRLVWKKTDFALYREIFSFSMWTMIISIAGRLTINFTPSILAITTGSVAVALYSPANSISTYYYGLAVAINGLFLPKISRMISQKNDDGILQLMIRVGRYQTFLLGLVWIGFFCVGKDFMILWMGEDFVQSYYCTLLIMLPSLFEYSQQIANTTVVAKNEVKSQAILVTATSLISCLLSFGLSYLMGAIGACTAICVIGLLNVLGMNIIHKKKLGINILQFYKECYGRLFPPMAGVLLLGFLICRLIPLAGILGLICKSAIIVILYFLVMWLLGLNKDEKLMILSLFDKILKRKSR